MFGNHRWRRCLMSVSLTLTPHHTAIEHLMPFLSQAHWRRRECTKMAVEDRRGTFTPFVLSVDGLLHKEASHFLKHMATALSSKWDKAYSITSSYIRSRLAFAGVRAVSLCIRGSRTKWRSGLGFDDGAPLASFME